MKVSIVQMDNKSEDGGNDKLQSHVDALGIRVCLHADRIAGCRLG
jgi:hypothetical protein